MVSIANRRQQTGSAMTELALVAPFIVLLLLSLIDGVLVAKDYFVITEMAREGVLAASTMARLPIDTEVTNAPVSHSELIPCFDSSFRFYQPTSGNESLCADRVIRWRMMKLGVALGKGVTSNGYQIHLRRNQVRGSVTIEIKKEWKGSSPAFRNITVRSRAEGPYSL